MTVGSHNEPYYLHPGLLRAKSGFFRGCLSGQYVESSANEITLPEDNDGAFGIFVDWVYSGKVAIDSGPLGTWKVILNAIILADKHICPELQNLLMDKLQDWFTKNEASPEDIIHLIKYDQQSSMVMRYLLKQLAYDLVKSGTVTDKSGRWIDLLTLDGNITKQLLEAVLEVKNAEGRSDPSNESHCLWHTHEGGADLGCSRSR